MLYCKISKNGIYSYVVPLDDAEFTIREEFEDCELWAEDGDIVNVEFIDMSVDDYNSMMEFDEVEEWVTNGH